MSFYSRPNHLRIPGPSQPDSTETAEISPETGSKAISEDSITPGSTKPTPEKETPAPPAAASLAAPAEPEVTGSALEAWSGSEATAAPAPRVREASTTASKAPRQAAPARATIDKSKQAAPRKSAPAKPVATHQQEADETQQRHIEAHRETRILVIENDVEAADHVIDILESDGYAVEIATDPTYGAMLAQTYLPHLILMGALSEQLSGADFMRSLRNTSGFAERSQVTPVLYLIDNSQLLQQRFQGLRDTPLTSTIFKPANQRELLQKVERALSPDADFPGEEL